MYLSIGGTVNFADSMLWAMFTLIASLAPEITEVCLQYIEPPNKGHLGIRPLCPLLRSCFFSLSGGSAAVEKGPEECH